MTMLTQLKALADAQEKATKGPWLNHKLDTSCGRAYRIGSGEMLVAGKGCCIIYDDYPSKPDNERSANASFIAEAGSVDFRAIEQRFWEMEEALRHFYDYGYDRQMCGKALGEMT